MRLAYSSVFMGPWRDLKGIHFAATGVLLFLLHFFWILLSPVQEESVV